MKLLPFRMDLSDADLAKTLECAVCFDVFNEPKMLICGHTVCQTCVNNIIAAPRMGQILARAVTGIASSAPNATGKRRSRRTVFRPTIASSVSD